MDQLVGELWTLRRIACAENYFLKVVREEIIDDGPDDDSLIVQTRGGDDSEKVIIKVEGILEKVFIVPHTQSAFERLLAFKRQVLSSVLSLEKELERRNQDE